MRIAYDPQIFCMQRYGGVSRYYCEIASRISRISSVKVTIAAPLHINNYLQKLPPRITRGIRGPNTDRFLTKAGVNYPFLAMRGLGVLMGDLILRAIKPDIIHETYYFSHPFGGKCARRVLTIYDMIHEKFPEKFPFADKTARHKAIAAARADHVICISESTQRDVMEILGLPAGKVSVIHMGFDLMNHVHRESVRNPIKEPYILYVGERGGYKNFMCLLEAYAASALLRQNCKLVCFGGGAFRSGELQLIRNLRLDVNRVIQLGGDDLLLAELYREAIALVYPSRYEGFGMPPLEAMSHNCPVICSRTSSIPEVVGDAGAYFDPDDMESMRVTIEDIVNSSDERELLISKGKERLKNFSWDQCAAQTLEVYTKLI